MNQLYETVKRLQHNSLKMISVYNMYGEKIMNALNFDDRERKSMLYNILRHDFDRYNPTDLNVIANYAYGVEKNEELYNTRIKIHNANSPHHWEYYDGKRLIPDLYIAEMILEWTAISNNGLLYYINHKDDMQFVPATRTKIEYVLQQVFEPSCRFKD